MRTLVVHPSDRIGAAIKERIAQSGHLVAVARDEGEALELLRSDIGQFELAIVYDDESMGLRLYRSVLKEHRHIEFIFLVSSAKRAKLPGGTRDFVYRHGDDDLLLELVDLIDCEYHRG
jgi:hypothetical protein